MAAAMTTLPFQPTCPVLSSGSQNALKGTKLRIQLPVSSLNRNRRQGMGPIRAYGGGFGGAQSRSANTQPGTEIADVGHSGNTLYDLLGISETVNLKEIKSAYRQKARQYHPDSNPPAEKDECTRIFLKIQEAYHVLGDPDSRADYDNTLHHPLTSQSLKSAISFRRGKSRHSRSCAGSAVDQELKNKGAWKSQWSSQLHGLRSSAGRKPGSWAAAMNQKK